MNGYLCLFLALVTGGWAQQNASNDFFREMMCSLRIYPAGNEIVWDDPDQQQDFIDNGQYNATEMLPTRFQTHKFTTFLAYPRYRPGIPATLMEMRMDDFCRIDPLLSPFPSWAANNYSSSAPSFVNIIDLFLDETHVLWLLDIGVINTLTDNPQVIGSPILWAVCPESGKILGKKDLSHMLCTGSRVQHIQVEVTGDGTFVYIGDAGTAAILVWDVKEHSGSKVSLPNEVTDCSLDRDVLYILLVRKDAGETFLYFTYLMGERLYSIQTDLIRRGELGGGVNSIGVKPGHMVLLGTDGSRTIFFRMRGERDIFSWDTSKKFNHKHFKQITQETQPRYSSHVSPGFKGLIWSLDSNFQEYLERKQGSLGPLPRLQPLIKLCTTKPECENIPINVTATA